MSRRPWTGRELTEAKRLLRAGSTHRQIAAALGRTMAAVKSALQTAGATRGRHPAQALAPHMMAEAKASLEREVRAAKAEAGRAKPFRGGGSM